MAKHRSISGYHFTKRWFDFAYGNPNVKPNDGILYMYLVELNNRLRWRESFGITTSDVMANCGYSTRRQFRKSLDNLIEWGFVKEVIPSKNQFQCNVISLLNACAESAQAKAQAEAQALAQAKAQAEALFTKQETINKKRVFVPPQLSDVIEFFIENGFSEPLAIEAYKTYNDLKWHDTRGNKIKDWKSKMRKVWFKNNSKAPVFTNVTTTATYENEDQIPFKIPQDESIMDKYYGNDGR